MGDLSSEAIRDKVYVYSSISAFKEKDFYPQALAVFHNYCSTDGTLSKSDTHAALHYCLGWSKQKRDKAIAALLRHELLVDGDSEESSVYKRFFDDAEGCYISGFTCIYRLNGDTMSGFSWKDCDGSMIAGVSFDTEMLFDIIPEVDDMTLKLYMFLSIQDSYWKSQNTSYMFYIRGENGLVDKMGYAQSNSTAQKMSHRLRDLMDKGYIEYSESHVYKTRFGKPLGQLTQLIRVNR